MWISEWVWRIEGTDAAPLAAAGLALMSAVCHAVFGALQKGRHDPWLVRGAIDIWYGLLALPVALFLVPLPEGDVWFLLIGVFFIHTAYKLALAVAYSRAAFTVVYPVVRGTGPLATVAFAGIVFGESYAVTQWLGVLCLSGGIFGLALYNYLRTEVDRPVLLTALGFAVLTGLLVAIYTTYDAYGMRAVPDPMTFLVWFFVVDGIAFPPISFWIWHKGGRVEPVWPLLRVGLAGAIIAFFSFGGVMLATRLDKVGEAAVLRETSVVFAALIGWFILKEPVGPRRLGIIAIIALGAVLVEFGG